MHTNELVSVVVVTYNSEKTVIETLDSIASQTYKDIELIITDDASQDKTVATCQKWINKYKDRFVNLELITVRKNTGISANANRGAQKAQGVWVKLIAGDDLLFSQGIELFMNEYKGKAMIVSCDYISFTGKFSGNKHNKRNELYSERLEVLQNCTAEKQLIKLLLGYRISAPSTMIRRELFSYIGWFDERYPMIEDYPFWIKALKNGFHIDYCPVLMAYYRIGNNISIGNASFFNIKYIKCYLKYEKELMRSTLPCKYISWFNYYSDYTSYLIFNHIFKNKKNKFGNWCYSMYEKITNRIRILFFKMIYSNV